MVPMMSSPLLLYGHKIGNLGHAINRKEARDENIGFRQIELFMAHAGYVLGSDTKKTAFVGIEEGTKDARRVETWNAAPINGAIFSHESDRMQVADDGIVFNRLVLRGGLAGILCLCLLSWLNLIHIVSPFACGIGHFVFRNTIISVRRLLWFVLNVLLYFNLEVATQVYLTFRQSAVILRMNKCIETVPR